MKINHHIWADVRQGLEGPSAFASSRQKAFFLSRSGQSPSVKGPLCGGQKGIEEKASRIFQAEWHLHNCLKSVWGTGSCSIASPKDPGMSRTFLKQFAWWDCRFLLLRSRKILIATFVVLQYQDQQTLALFLWAPKAGSGRWASSGLSEQTNELFHTFRLRSWPSPSLPWLTSQPHTLPFCYFPAS